MKNLKKLILPLIAILILTGCTTLTYTYDVDTGDKIEITLKTNDKYSIDSNVPFTISKDSNTICTGTFITLDSYDAYLKAVQAEEDAKILDQGTKNGVDYLLYSYTVDAKEYNYILKVTDSNTGIVLSNTKSEKEARECFKRLSFEKK